MRCPNCLICGDTLVPQYTVDNHATARVLARDPSGRQLHIPVPSRVVDAPLLCGSVERTSNQASSSGLPLKRPHSPSPVVRHSRIRFGDDDSVVHASPMDLDPPMDVPEPPASDAATAPTVNEDTVRSSSSEMASGALNTPNSPPSNVFRLRSLSYMTPPPVPPPASPYDPWDADDEDVMNDMDDIEVMTGLPLEEQENASPAREESPVVAPVAPIEPQEVQAALSSSNPAAVEVPALVFADITKFPSHPPRDGPRAVYTALHREWAVRAVLKMVAYLHVKFQVPFRACALILFTLNIIFSAKNIVSPTEPMPTTLTTLLKKMTLQDRFHVLPVCVTCSSLFDPPVPKDLEVQYIPHGRPRWCPACHRSGVSGCLSGCARSVQPHKTASLGYYHSPESTYRIVQYFHLTLARSTARYCHDDADRRRGLIDTRQTTSSLWNSETLKRAVALTARPHPSSYPLHPPVVLVLSSLTVAASFSPSPTIDDHDAMAGLPALCNAHCTYAAVVPDARNPSPPTQGLQIAQLSFPLPPPPCPFTCTAHRTTHRDVSPHWTEPRPTPLHDVDGAQASSSVLSARCSYDHRAPKRSASSHGGGARGRLPRRFRRRLL